MDTISTFKQYLETLNKRPSNVTIKNYTSDIRKFISWYQNEFQRPFIPQEITTEIIQLYRKNIIGSNLNATRSITSISTTSSADRYLSALRKYYECLNVTQLCSTNPFNLLTNQPSQTEIDPWYIKNFKNSLKIENISDLTIKNYIIDINQFLNWITEVTNHKPEYEKKTPVTFQNISTEAIQEYKSRLLHDLRLHPASINRKLSSIRRYVTWANAQGLLTKHMVNVPNIVERDPIISNTVKSPVFIFPAPEAETSQIMAEDESQREIDEDEVKSKRTYSKFPPLRLMQKIAVGTNILFDLSFIIPIAKSIEELKFRMWLFSGKQIFDTAKSVSSATISSINSDNPLPNLNKFSKVNDSVLHLVVPNFKKAFYAPHLINTDELPFHKKAAHHIKHSRPKWYRRYHEHSLAHYVHFSLLIIFMSAMGILVFKHFTTSEGAWSLQSGVLAANTSPPRTLSFQGRLRDQNDLPITGETNLRFGIYNDQISSGSAQLWQEIQRIKPDRNGSFTVLLGTRTLLPHDIFTQNTSLYVGITINKDAELIPRQPLATTSFAASTDSLQGMSPITQTNAGTKNVVLALDSTGNLTIGGNANPTFQATGGVFTLSGNVLNLTTAPGSNSDVTINPDGTGKVDLQKMIHNSTNNNTMQSAAGAVEVDDLFAVLATSSGQSAFTINQNGSGPIISASSSGIAKFTVTGDGTALFGGNVGIGLTSPTGALTINNSTNTEMLFSGNEKANIYQEASGNSLSLTTNTGDLILGANGRDSQQITLKASGNVGIATNNPADFKLQVAGNIGPNSDLTYDLGSTNFRWNKLYVNEIITGTEGIQGYWQKNNGVLSPSKSTDDFTIGGASTQSANVKFSARPNGNSFIATGNLGIGTTTPGSKFSVLGLQAGSGDAVHIDTNGNFFRFTSSRQYKHDIASLDREFAKILEVQPVSFTYNESGIKDIGYIAEEFDQIGLNDLVTYDSSGKPNGVKYDRVSLYTLEVVKEQAKKIAKLETSSNNINSLINITNNINLDNNGNFNIIEENEMFTLYKDSSPVRTTAGFGTVIAGKIETGLISTRRLIANGPVSINGMLRATKISSEEIATNTILLAGVNLETYITNTIKQMLNLQNENNVIVSPIINSNKIATNVISPLSSETIEINGNTIINNSDDKKPTLDVKGSASISGQLATSDLQASDASISGTVRTKKLIAEDLDLSDDAITRLGDRLKTSLAANNSSTSNSATTTQNASTPTPTISQSITPTPTTPQNQEPESEETIMTDYIDGASLSAMLAYVPTLKSDFATFTEGLMSFGATSLGDTSVAGQFSVGGSLIIADNSINVLGTTLEIQPLRQGNISFMSGLVAIDTDGNFSVAGNATFAKNVSIKGTLSLSVLSPIPNEDLIVRLQDNTTLPDGTKRKDSKFVIQNASGEAKLSINSLGDLIASGAGHFQDLFAKNLKVARSIQADTSLTETVASSSAGTATINRNQTERTIITPFVKEDSLIYITPVSDTLGQTPYIARQTSETPESKGSFTIAIPKTVTKDIKINWWIIN